MTRNLLFTFFVLITACKNPGSQKNNSVPTNETSSESCVERIFQEDSILGAVRNHASEKIALSEAINIYASDLESLNYKSCPENFVTAFHNHIDAWKAVTKISDKYPELRGELHDIFAQIERTKDSVAFKSLVEKVWDTWKIVENTLN